MKRLLILLALVSCATPIGDTAPPPTLWDRACTALSLEMDVPDACGDLAEPVVVISQVVDHVGGFGGRLRGLYIRGEKYIFINSLMFEQYQDEVIVHEMVHYIGALLDYDWGKERCVSEAMARLVAFTAGFSFDPTWRERYNCEIPTDKD